MSLPPPDSPAGSAAPASSAFTPHRLGVIILTLFSLGLAWSYMTVLSRSDPWYRNTDMNIHNLVDALAINSDVPPANIDQPGFSMKYLLALDYRVRHYAGALPVWNLKKLRGSPDPLPEIRNLVHLGRIHSRVLVMLFILAAAGFTWTVTRSLESSCFTILLLCGSSGLLFHGLLNRPELLCTGFGCLLALQCVWHATSARDWPGHHLWLFLAGFACGLALLTKLPGLAYLVACHAWCWLAALTRGHPSGADTPTPADPYYWRGFLPALSGAALLWLMVHLAHHLDALSPVATLRIRLLAGLVAVLPLLTLGTARNRFLAFLLARGHDLALLGGGVLAAIVLSYPVLRAVMSEARGADYFMGILQLVFDPARHMQHILTTQPDVVREYVLFLKETPLLFGSTIALVVGVSARRSIPLHLRSFVALLLLLALGITLLMSRRYFFAPYSIFAQVPLLLAWSLGLFALGVFRPRSGQTGDVHWLAPAAVVAALVLTLTVWFRVQPKYDNYQADAGLPVNDFTLTFLYDHESHPKAYRQLMEEHYGSREKFAQALEHYLADPAHLY